jgi:hypothetical protein
MLDDYVVMTKLEGGVTLAIAAEPIGDQPVAVRDVVTDLGAIASSIERVSRDIVERLSHEMLETARKAGPSKVTVELGFGLAVETGHVVAVLGKGRGEASLRVILEWSRDTEDRP